MFSWLKYLSDPRHDHVEQGVNEQGVLTGLLLQRDSKAEFIYVPPLHEKPNVFYLDINYREYALQYSCMNIAHIVECSNLQLYTVIKLNFASTLLSISFLFHEYIGLIFEIIWSVISAPSSMNRHIGSGQPSSFSPTPSI